MKKSRKYVFAFEKHDISYHGSNGVSNNVMRGCMFPSMESNKTKVHPIEFVGWP
jgi:hypothetical protein